MTQPNTNVHELINRTGLKPHVKPADRTAPPRTTRVVQCFLNTDFRYGHEGLAGLAKREGINVKDLSPGEYVFFLNAAKNRIKLYAAGNVVAYLKLPPGQKIEMRTLQLIPRAFRGGVINYDEALRTVLTEATRKKV